MIYTPPSDHSQGSCSYRMNRARRAIPRIPPTAVCNAALFQGRPVWRGAAAFKDGNPPLRALDIQLECCRAGAMMSPGPPPGMTERAGATDETGSAGAGIDPGFFALALAVF